MGKLAVVIVALAALVVLAKLPGRRQEVPATEVPPVMVTVMTVTTESRFHDTFDLPAVVEPNQIVTVSAEVDGQIEWIGPKEGSVVHSGDLLLRLNTDLPEPRAAAQTTYDQSDSNAEGARVGGRCRSTRTSGQKLAVIRLRKGPSANSGPRFSNLRVAVKENTSGWHGGRGYRDTGPSWPSKFPAPCGCFFRGRGLDAPGREGPCSRSRAITSSANWRPGDTLDRMEITLSKMVCSWDRSRVRLTRRVWKTRSDPLLADLMEDGKAVCRRRSQGPPHGCSLRHSGDRVR
jgi:hypothetical protein